MLSFSGYSLSEVILDYLDPPGSVGMRAAVEFSSEDALRRVIIRVPIVGGGITISLIGEDEGAEGVLSVYAFEPFANEGERSTVLELVQAKLVNHFFWDVRSVAIIMDQINGLIDRMLGIRAAIEAQIAESIARTAGEIPSGDRHEDHDAVSHPGHGA